jgi:hypothetical protein
MPLPAFLTLAVPVIHSSGGWIASTSAGGYVASTLSSTWIGAFIAGNSGLLSSMGLVSAAGIFGSAGGLSALGSSAAAGLGSALSAVGLGGLATKLGLAPTLFLGLTPMGWAIVGSVSSVLASGAYLLFRSKMKEMNQERAKGDLEPITWKELIREVKREERRAIRSILEDLSRTTCHKIELIDDGKNVVIDGRSYPIGNLKYRVNKNEDATSMGSEELLYVKRLGKTERLILVRRRNEINSELPDGAGAT